MSDSKDSRDRRGSGWPAPAGPELPGLRAGDLVGVMAPGFAVRPAALDEGLRRLTGMGFTLRLGPHLRARDGYLAGTDEERAADLVALWTDPDVSAIWFARGGYGSARLLDRLPWARLRRVSKLLIGYSDATALLLPAADRTASRAVYGPVVTELGTAGAYDRATLAAALEGRPSEQRFRRSQVLAPGRATGRLVAGNLTVLVHLLGTRWFPDLSGAVLAIEDVGEPAYRIDRLLTQLRLAGRLSRLRGVLLGGLDAEPRRGFPPDRPLSAILEETFGPLGIPVVRDLRFGHVPRKRSLPIGAAVEIDTAARVVRIVPGGGR